MTNVAKLFELAQLAEASYAEFDKFSSDAIYSSTEARDALIALNGSDYKFSPTQASEFVSHWKVVHHKKSMGSVSIDFLK